jgi:hypothetical protein
MIDLPTRGTDDTSGFVFHHTPARTAGTRCT